MRKALVLGLLILGLGLAASAQLTGYWSTTIGIDPGAGAFGDFFAALDSTLSVKYALTGWEFSATSKFDIDGFAAQSFKASGSLGAFTFASNMSFDPAFITVRDYSAGNIGTHVTTGAAGGTYDYYTGMCPWDWVIDTVGPRFLKWDVTAGVNIAGVEIGAYVLQDNSNADVLYKEYLWDLNATAVQTNATICTSYKNGMGWRLKVAGSFGDVDVTSYTYFNLNEWDYWYYQAVYTWEPYWCPSIGKSGVFKIVNADCDVGVFYEEYLMVEGFAFGCATVDMALSIGCGGFNDFTVVVSDIALGGWGSLDFGLQFTTNSKAWSTCISLVALPFDCFTVELGFGEDGHGMVSDNVIDNITVHGISFSTTWGGVTFTSMTEFDEFSMLFSDDGYWTYLETGDAADTYAFLIPWVSKGKGGDCTTRWDDDDKLYSVSCVAADVYRLWEAFTIDVDADACCGGLFGLTVTTYFGDHEDLLWYGYALYEANAVSPSVITLYGKKTDAYAYEDYSSAYKYDTVDAQAIYSGGSDTLFNWAETTVDLSAGIGSNVTLTLGFDISAYGWESLEFGFKWAF